MGATSSQPSCLATTTDVTSHKATHANAMPTIAATPTSATMLEHRRSVSLRRSRNRRCVLHTTMRLVRDLLHTLLSAATTASTTT